MKFDPYNKKGGGGGEDLAMLKGRGGGTNSFGVKLLTQELEVFSHSESLFPWL